MKVNYSQEELKMKTGLTSKDGVLISDNGWVLSASEGDRIARSVGLQCAEELVRALKGIKK